MFSAQTWLLAPKRSCRASIPSDWLVSIRSMPGVHVDNEFNGRVTLQAEPEALDAIRRRFGYCLNIENLMERRTRA